MWQGEVALLTPHIAPVARDVVDIVLLDVLRTLLAGQLVRIELETLLAAQVAGGPRAQRTVVVAPPLVLIAAVAAIGE
jgi:hypothetical protein